MTQEDIEIEACLYEDACHNPSVQQHFIDGANWAKDKMIEKLCVYMENFNQGSRIQVDIDSWRKFLIDAVEMELVWEQEKQE